MDKPYGESRELDSHRCVLQPHICHGINVGEKNEKQRTKGSGLGLTAQLNSKHFSTTQALKYTEVYTGIKV